MSQVALDRLTGASMDESLEALLAQLELLRMLWKEDPAGGQRDATGQYAAWADDDNIYVEVPLPEWWGPDVDVCLHQGRAFIRMDH